MFVASQKILAGTMKGDGVRRLRGRGHRRSGRSRTPTWSSNYTTWGKDLDERVTPVPRAAADGGADGCGHARLGRPYLYCAPLVALLVLIFGYPLVKVVDFSTRLIRGASGPVHRARQLPPRPRRPDLPRGRASTARLLLLAVPVLLVDLDPRLASLLYEQVRGWRIYRSVLFLPYILAVPVVGIVASYMFSSTARQRRCSRRSGLDQLAIDWLGSEHYALMTVADRDRLARGRLRHRALPGAPDEPGRRAARGRAHRRRRLVAAAPARDPARVARHDRVLRRDRRRSPCWRGSSPTSGRSRRAARATRRRRSRSTSTTPARCNRCPGMAAAVATCCSVSRRPFIALLFWVRRRASSGPRSRRRCERGRRSPAAGARGGGSPICRTTSCSWARRCSRSSRCCSCS